VKGHDKPELL
jgi:hypothetical protein